MKENLLEMVIDEGQQDIDLEIDFKGETVGIGGGGGGVVFIPSVDEDGDLSWSNNGGLPNPETVNIKGDPGEPGKDGISPTVKITNITGGKRITITDINGTKSADIMDGEDGTDGEDGEDGVSPTVSVSKSGKITTVTITDKNGTKTAKINDGADGTSVTVKSVSESIADGGSNVITFSDGKTVTVKNGSAGKDGEDGQDGSNGVSATHSWNGTTLTVTSASGTSSANLKGDKGDKGDPGEKGETGETGAAGKDGANGKDGVDGYTPVKGTDYWTDADKAEIKSYVDDAILGGAW